MRKSSKFPHKSVVASENRHFRSAIGDEQTRSQMARQTLGEFEMWSEIWAES